MKVYTIAFIILIACLFHGCNESPPDNYTPPLVPGEPGNVGKSAVSAPKTDTQPDGIVTQIVVVYFHRPQRCTKCLCFEERVSHVIYTYFQNELESGKLAFKIIDLGEPENTEIARKYAAVGSQLFVNVIVDDEEHIRDIQGIWSWNCTGEEQAFDSQIRNVIEQSLEGAIE
jgi:hypothetical protein